MHRRRWLLAVALGTGGIALYSGVLDDTDERDGAESLASLLRSEGLDDPDWELSEVSADEQTLTFYATNRDDHSADIEVTVHEEVSAAETQFRELRSDAEEGDRVGSDVSSADVGDEGFSYTSEAKARLAFRDANVVAVVDHRWQQGGSTYYAREIASLLMQRWSDSSVVKTD